MHTPSFGNDYQPCWFTSDSAYVHSAIRIACLLFVTAELVVALCPVCSCPFSGSGGASFPNCASPHAHIGVASTDARGVGRCAGERQGAVTGCCASLGRECNVWTHRCGHSATAPVAGTLRHAVLAEGFFAAQLWLR